MMELLMPIGLICSLYMIYVSLKVLCDDLGDMLFGMGLLGSVIFGIGTIITLIGLI